MTEATLYLNGTATACIPGTSLVDFLARSGFNPRLVAVEYNGEILHRHHWGRTQLQPDDHLEVVTIVGGGKGEQLYF
ncbi:thiamine biosynthesis protein ThiS [Rubidibacter lacunae KORDI 51-2]|uniref:Thiamine biosynthesis protein ThiS n=1 Tax=Rubidibacter lacunae KORDI 51-2 TaxID=582515 RepID=U5DK25_9CHRO|nr:sulfur carrier protein ThiS [Rubidibacter lacunae]ERN40929.1 thiamine biosynthesis protein ThiS [Rubidibacter lacunae KORDI 51-2]